jgi:hypothetical protein
VECAASVSWQEHYVGGGNFGLVTSEGTVARRRPVDIAATIVLLIGHAALALFTYLAAGLVVMGTDPCGYMRCGDQQWAEVGVLTAMIGGLNLGAAGWAIVSQAGPV